jgi:hypothetical protein
VTTYDQYRQLRIECGYDDEFAMIPDVWNGCEPAAQEDMLRQLREGAARRVAELAKFGGDHW